MVRGAHPAVRAGQGPARQNSIRSTRTKLTAPGKPWCWRHPGLVIHRTLPTVGTLWTSRRTTGPSFHDVPHGRNRSREGHLKLNRPRIYGACMKRSEMEAARTFPAARAAGPDRMELKGRHATDAPAHPEKTPRARPQPGDA